MKEETPQNIEVAYTDVPHKKISWYNHPSFPLVPQFTEFKHTEREAGGFSFSWLFLKAWTLHFPSLSAEVTIDAHWGIGLLFTITYLRVILAIPMPLKWSTWFYKTLGRKPKNYKQTV